MGDSSNPIFGINLQMLANKNQQLILIPTLYGNFSSLFIYFCASCLLLKSTLIPHLFILII